jgi:Chromate transporter
MSDTETAPPAGRDVVPLRRAVRAWFAISLQTFGGPAGQIAVMQRHLVDERRWIGQRGFLHALNYCMLLPGPEPPRRPRCAALRVPDWGSTERRIRRVRPRCPAPRGG